MNNAEYLKDDINDFFDSFVCSWQNKSLFSSCYEAGLYTFLSVDEVGGLLGRKKKLIREYEYIDDEYLMRLTAPLYLTKKYKGSEYRDYLAKLASEINEFKALEEIRKYLGMTFEDRYESEPLVQQRVHGIFTNFKKRAHRPGDKLAHQSMLRIDSLTAQYLKPERRHYQEQAVFILAQTGVLSGIKCQYKTPGTKCSYADCVSKRFNIIKLSVCLNTNTLEHCRVCHAKKDCPSYYPCPPGVSKYKKKVQRKKKAQKT